jgi:hypothetical protein
MIGARCGQDEGLYDQPGGASGPGFILMPGTTGMPGMSRTKAITSAPASVSLAKPAAVGAWKMSGAASSQTPTNALAQGVHTDRRTSVTTASTMMRIPLITSLKLSATLW